MNLFVKGVLAVVGTVVALPVVSATCGVIGTNRGAKSSGVSVTDIQGFFASMQEKVQAGDQDAAEALERINADAAKAVKIHLDIAE